MRHVPKPCNSELHVGVVWDTGRTKNQTNAKFKSVPQVLR